MPSDTKSEYHTHVNLHRYRNRLREFVSFQDASGVLLDAHFEVRNGKLFLLSRGGTKGAANVRNTQYGPALRILLERINQSALSLAGAWSIVVEFNI